MSVQNKVNTVLEVYSKLDDEESRKIFESRLQFLEDGNRQNLIDMCRKIVDNKQFCSERLSEFLCNKDKNKVIIFGGGLDGNYTLTILRKIGINVSYFCDNNVELQGTWKFGIPVISVEEVCYKYRDYTVILASTRYADKFNNQLINNFFPQENIFYPRSGMLAASCGTQYFDFEFVKPCSDEVYIDAGTYDGNTVLDFCRWCDSKYEKIYAFEPNGLNREMMNKKLNGVANIEVVPKGTWSKETSLFFKKAGPASKLDNKGEDEVPVTSIDSVLRGERATYIKMDVEGAEMESLIGAKNTIQKYYPRLAICLYHKQADFIQIPAYIMSIAPLYKFAFRHYSTSAEETILYAWKE